MHVKMKYYSISTYILSKMTLNFKVKFSKIPWLSSVEKNTKDITTSFSNSIMVKINLLNRKFSEEKSEEKPLFPSWAKTLQGSRAPCLFGSRKALFFIIL